MRFFDFVVCENWCSMFGLGYRCSADFFQFVVGWNVMEVIFFVNLLIEFY